MKLLYKITIALASLLLLSTTPSKKASLKHALKVLDGFCNYVPSGNSVIDGDTIPVQSFYMSKTEITNIQYQEFIYSLMKNNDEEKLAVAKVDSLKWERIFKTFSGEQYGKFYHKHPAYHSYPTVNVSREGAELYCEWLTAIYDSISDHKLKIKFRIPTRAEWMRAARGDNHQYLYAWGGPFIRNAKGNVLANYVRLGAENITKNQETGKFEVKTFPVPFAFSNINGDADVLAPAESYWPNYFGFYNMNGNVSEMISDGDFSVGGGWSSPGYDIRNESIKPFTGAHPTVGFRIVATYIQPGK